METQPRVSCFCLTYSRPRLFEEAIVLNDYADQVLAFDHPGEK